MVRPPRVKSPVVDAQNADDPLYETLLTEGVPSLAFQAAEALIMEGVRQPNGYTEMILSRARRAKKRGVRSLADA
jgi:malate synthase